MARTLKQNATMVAFFGCLFFLSSSLSAQDSFNTIINLPGDPFVDSIPDSVRVGQAETTQVNVMDGGVVGNSVSVDNGSEFNISGGTIGFRFSARRGSTVNVSGGQFGIGFEALPGSNVNLFGGDFNLNGSDFDGSTITLEGADVFTCTLPDGEVLIFNNNDIFAGVTLIPRNVPPVDQSPIVIDTEIPVGRTNLRSGQLLTVEDGGFLPGSLNSVDATISVNGGAIGVDELGTNFIMAQTVVDMNAGVMNFSSVQVLSGSELNIRGGMVAPIADGDRLQTSFVSADPGGVINVSGGVVETENLGASGGTINVSGGAVTAASAGGGGTINISGGTVGRGGFSKVTAGRGGVINIRGGMVSNVGANGPFGDDTRIGTVNLFGSNFVQDGVPIDDNLVPGNRTIVGGRDIFLTGILEDGSPISVFLSSQQFRSISPGAILSVTLIERDEEPELDPTEAVLDFEDVSEWMVINGNSNIGASDVANNGQTSLEVEGAGYTVVESPKLSTDDLPLISSNVSIDLFVGSNQPNPYWVGAMQFYIHAPSANLHNAYVGQIELTGVAQDEFTTLTFDLPARIASALAGTHDDVQLRYALNVNRGSGPYYLDNIQFGGQE